MGRPGSHGIRGTVYDGVEFHSIHYGTSTADWIRGLTLLTLRRLAHGDCRAVTIDPATVRRLALAELARREPQHERGTATAAAVNARRRWVTLFPVLTNYSNGESS